MKKLIAIIPIFISSVATATDLLLWRENSDSIMIDRYSIQRIFTRQITRWPNGQHISVFIKPKESVEHRDFVVRTLGISPFYYEQQLERQTYAGKSSSVTEIPTDIAMVQRVENTPGAIGYINYEIYIGSKKVIIVDTDTITN